MSDVYAELAELGVATVFEASGRRGLIDADLERIVPGTRAAGPARTVRCGDGDNLMVHAAIEHAQAGEVLVLTMPAPKPVTLMGETSSRHRRKPGCRGGARRCCRSRRRRAARARAPGLGAIHPRARGPDKNVVGELDQPVEVGGVTIRPRDVVVLDADGAVVVERERVDDVLDAARQRAEAEREKRAKLEAGALSYDLDGLRERVEGASV